MGIYFYYEKKYNVRRLCNSLKSFHLFDFNKRLMVFFILKVIEFKHGNIASMLGICTDADTPCVIWEYCSKGSVQVRFLYLLFSFILQIIFYLYQTIRLLKQIVCEKLSWDEMP